ncbi:DUF5309 family protein [Veillonella montpellierensis]|uniref:SU10 major capsid protein n=1 Tax=Veillonella montpellierensis TaxID=187328 RepID=UPI00068F5814|nr:DUF5309 family protein [Veillonella montpellierensis]
MAKDKAVLSFNVVGRVEDMNDLITSIDPDQTLLTKRFGKTTVTSTEHGWLTDSLRPAMKNATVEAHDFDTREAIPRKRASNYTQQFEHGYTISDTTQAIKKYGVRDELAYQMVKATKEIGRDLEYAVVKNATKTLGDNSTPGEMGGIAYFLGEYKDVTVDAQGVFTTNEKHKFVVGDVIKLAMKTGTLDSKFVANKPYYVRPKTATTFTIHATEQEAQADTNPVKPTSAVSTGLQYTYNNITDVSLKKEKGEFTFDSLNDAMQDAWNRGASIDMAVMSGANKRKASTFTANTVKNRNQTDTKLTQVIDVIETDFGMIDLVAHRMYDDDVVDLLELQYWKLGYLIPFHVEDVPRKGTYKEKVITGVATLECTAPIANARIKGITA